MYAHHASQKILRIQMKTDSILVESGMLLIDHAQGAFEKVTTECSFYCNSVLESVLVPLAQLY